MSVREIKSQKSQISDFINSLAENNEEIFPYLANRNWEKGKPIFYSGPYWDNEEIIAAMNTLISGKWLSAGENINKFEIAFSKKFGFKRSVMVNSGSSANLIMIAALKKYFGWENGDEIIVCVCGFPTTVNPIIQNGLKPVFVDIDFKDLNWDLNSLLEKITSRTVAVISSPVLGNPYDMDKFLSIVKEYKLQYIADNCDSLGSKWDNNYLTKEAIASSCSFYPAHHICTIEGGMVSSNNEDIISIARSFAWWGRDCYCVGIQNKLPNGTCGKRFEKWLDGYNNVVDHKYVFGVQGYNLKPADLLGSIGLVQLKKYEEIHKVRRKNKELIGKIFERIPGTRIIKEMELAETSWFGVPIVCSENNDKFNKKNVVKFLEENGIQTRNYFAGNLLMHPAYKGLDNPLKYPNAIKVLDKVFFVGCSPVITEEMINHIDYLISLFLKEFS